LICQNRQSCDSFIETGGFDMRRIFFVVAAILTVMLAVPVVGLAQAPTAPVTGMKPDRTAAPLGVREKMREKEAVLRKKRAECRAKAKAEKIPLTKRPAYVKKCRAEGN
jgi:hypothetical protein